MEKPDSHAVKGITDKRSGLMRTAGEKGTAHLLTLCHRRKANKRKTGASAPVFFREENTNIDFFRCQVIVRENSSFCLHFCTGLV